MQLERLARPAPPTRSCSRAPIRPRDTRPRWASRPAPRASSPTGSAPTTSPRLAPSEDAADFLFVGELRRLKGVDVMLRALARVREARPVSAVIVGTGPDAAAFKDETARLGLDDVVSFRDAMPAREAFALGRVLVVPSRAESFPYIVLEAAAAGLPMLATNVGGIPEIVSGTDTALLPPEDVDALAQAMLERARPIPRPRRPRRCGCRQRSAGASPSAAMTDAVLELYASVMRPVRLGAS